MLQWTPVRRVLQTPLLLTRKACTFISHDAYSVHCGQCAHMAATVDRRAPDPNDFGRVRFASRSWQCCCFECFRGSRQRCCFPEVRSGCDIVPSGDSTRSPTHDESRAEACTADYLVDDHLAHGRLQARDHQRRRSSAHARTAESPSYGAAFCAASVGPVSDEPPPGLGRPWSAARGDRHRSQRWALPGNGQRHDGPCPPSLSPWGRRLCLE